MYVALGDSISIDAYAGGAGRGGASLLARNRDDDFPEWRGRDLETLDRGLRWAVLATDGGNTGTVLEHQLPQLERLAAAPSVVTLTVGGNDVLSCYGDTRGANEVVSTVRRRVGEALRRLTDIMCPNGRVVLGTRTTQATARGTPPALAFPLGRTWWRCLRT